MVIAVYEGVVARAAVYRDIIKISIRTAHSNVVVAGAAVYCNVLRFADNAIVTCAAVNRNTRADIADYIRAVAAVNCIICVGVTDIIIVRSCNYNVPYAFAFDGIRSVACVYGVKLAPSMNKIVTRAAVD